MYPTAATCIHAVADAVVPSKLRARRRHRPRSQNAASTFHNGRSGLNSPFARVSSCLMFTATPRPRPVVALQRAGHAAEAAAAHYRGDPSSVRQYVGEELAGRAHLMRPGTRDAHRHGQPQAVHRDSALRTVEPVFEVPFVERRTTPTALDDLTVDHQQARLRVPPLPGS